MDTEEPVAVFVAAKLAEARALQVRLMEEGLEECSLKEQLLDQLQRCLDKLPDANRHLVLAAYEPGSTIEDLAKRLGRKANAVYQQLWRLRRALGKCVNNSLQNETAETIS